MNAKATQRLVYIDLRRPIERTRTHVLVSRLEARKVVRRNEAHSNYCTPSLSLPAWTDQHSTLIRAQRQRADIPLFSLSLVSSDAPESNYGAHGRKKRPNESCRKKDKNGFEKDICVSNGGLFSAVFLRKRRSKFRKASLLTVFFAAVFLTAPLIYGLFLLIFYLN